jgi:Hpt domain
MTTSAPDRLLELQQRFLVGLEVRLTDLTTTLDGSSDPDLLMRMFHSLVGIGGTYGFPQITEISRFCEAACVNVIEKERTMSFDEQEHLRRAVAEMRVFAASGPVTIAA